MPSTPTIPTCGLTISQAHQAIIAKQMSSADLVRSYLARVEAYDQKGPALNSIVSINPTAIEEAETLDASFQNTNDLVGPLHGVPLLVKDNIETEQMPTSFGNKAFARYQPIEDSHAVAKLRAAGAIILGKTAMPDFATSWWGYSSRSGNTKNPYKIGHDPGGSSSGTGSAIASNFALAGLGTDCGGSVRLPSSFDNLVGIRCTPGMVSRHGLAMLIFQQDTIGPMTRTVEDGVRLFDVLAGYDARDPLTVSYGMAKAQGSYLSALKPKSLELKRLGVVTNLMGSPNDEGADVNEVIHSGLQDIRSAGAETIELQLGNLDQHIAETSLYQNCSKADINKFLSTRPHSPIRTLQQLYETREYHPKLDLLEACAFGPELPELDPLYHKRLASREIFTRMLLNVMDNSGIDAFVYPTVRVPSPTRKELDNGRWATMEFPTNTLIAAQAWLPAVSVPVGFTKLGLPVGIEIVCRPYAEEELFALAYGVEQATQARKEPSVTPEL